MKAISTPAIITGIASKVDRSLSLRVNTPELSIPEKSVFFELQGKNVNLLIEPEDAVDEDVYEITRQMDTKTPSQRLRAVFFLLWKELNNPEQTFNQYYELQMEKIIEHFKAKLDNA